MGGVVMSLSKDEKLVLDKIWKTLRDTNRSIGFDEIADHLPLRDEDVRFICYDLEQKGWLRTSGGDIIYDRACRKKYTEYLYGPIPKNNQAGCSNCYGKEYKLIDKNDQKELRQCSYCGRRYKVEIINGIEKLL